MVWGTCHTIFFTLTMSHLDFLSRVGRFFFQAWAASNNSTSKFFSLPMLQNGWTCEREIIQGVQNTARVRTVPNTGEFFCPKIDEFHMILCRVTLDGQLWPSISSSSQLSSAQYFFSHHSYRCLLSTLECSLSIKHGILVQSSQNL
jgi:hypothetical protein